MSLFNELKRRNVLRVGAAYVVAAWLLIQVAETIFPLFGFDDTPARMVVIVLAIGLIPSMIFAWVFEWTPEGLVRDEDLDHARIDTRKTDQKLNRLIMVALALALGYFTFDKFVLDPAEDVKIAESARQEGRSAALTESFGDKSIAVMPFSNLSAAPENQFFADGIHDDLLTRISNIREIKTISRSSVMKYKDSTESLSTIAKALRVNTILEGGVQRAGDQVRINLKLIDVESDANLWAQTYTRELTATNVFIVQAEITEAVASALQTLLTEDERRQLEKQPTANLQALDAYYRGNQLLSEETSESTGKAVLAYQEAIRLDPDFSLAYSRQASAVIEQISATGLPHEVQLEKARPLIDQAILLDPQSSEAFTALGTWYRWMSETDKAVKAFEQAVALGPNNAEALAGYGSIAMFERSDPSEAVRLLIRAVDLDPQNIGLKRQLARFMPHAGLPGEGIRMMEDILTEHPDSAATYRDLAFLYSNWEFRHDKGIKVLRKAYELDPNHPPNSTFNAVMHWRLGDYENTALWMNHIAKLAPDARDARDFRGWAYIAQGDFESARKEFVCPTPTEAFCWLGVFYLGGLDTVQGRPENVIESYKVFAEGHNGKRSNINLYFAIVTIKAYQALGETEKAQVMADEWISIVEADPSVSYHDAPIHNASLHAMAGQVESAIAILEEWEGRSGATSLLQQDNRHGLSVLATDPRYQSIQKSVKSHLDEQKANLARWEASGEMQPMPKEVVDPQ